MVIGKYECVVVPEENAIVREVEYSTITFFQIYRSSLSANKKKI